MSGRVRWERDGQTVVGYRKTDRRQNGKSVSERLHELNLKVLKTSRSPGGAPSVHMAFMLPRSLVGFVAPGQHGIGVKVVSKGFVQVTAVSSEQCFAFARDFFEAVAKDRRAFTAYASLVSSKDPDRSFGRHLTVVSGTLVVSAGYDAPKVFEARAP